MNKRISWSNYRLQGDYKETEYSVEFGPGVDFCPILIKGLSIHPGSSLIKMTMKEAEELYRALSWLLKKEEKSQP